MLVLDNGKGIFESDPTESLNNPKINGTYEEIRELINR